MLLFDLILDEMMGTGVPYPAKYVPHLVRVNLSNLKEVKPSTMGVS